MKLYDIGINHNGTGSTLVLWVCDDDHDFYEWCSSYGDYKHITRKSK